MGSALFDTDLLAGAMLLYSCLIASIGDNRAARSDGKDPNTRPDTTDPSEAKTSVLTLKPA
jgi:hypothetical protein